MKIDPLWKLQIELLANALMNQTAIEISTLDRYAIPKKGRVYVFATITQDECIYVGKSGDLRDRVFDVHLNGKGKSSLRDALLGLKKTRGHTPVATEAELDDYIEQHYRLRFSVIEDITLRGCV